MPSGPRRAFYATVVCGLAFMASGLQCAAEAATFVFTSDLHYGIARSYFRGAANVEAQVVDAALLRKINQVPGATFPDDGGLRAGQAVGPIEFAVVTGDIANRQELYPVHIQTATESWRQFDDTFIKRFALQNARGDPTPLLFVPGNHDVSNAIGAPSKLVPETDATAMAEIFNRMMRPATPRTKDTFRYETDRIQFACDFGGVHCVFLTMWPDRIARAWMENDLKRVAATTPVFIFCHDQPDIEAKHLTNPNGAHDINARDRFENVVADICPDGPAAEAASVAAQRPLVRFLKAHRNIVGYFHGNSNWNEFYTWTGPDGDVALNVFRADSTMKGKESGQDEAKLSFQVVTYDVGMKTLTARECLWNARGPDETDETLVGWGAMRIISLAPREK